MKTRVCVKYFVYDYRYKRIPPGDISTDKKYFPVNFARCERLLLGH